MDLKHYWFNLRNYRPSNTALDNDDEMEEHVSLERRLLRFKKQQDKDTTIAEEQTLEEAPLLHSEAQNLQARDQGYKSSLQTNSTDPASTTATTSTVTPFNELANQLESQYDYRACSDCKIQAKYVCIQCHDSFCAVCYASNHRRG